MTVYIAGKITGNDRYKDQFRLAEASLTALGYRVINPAALQAGLNPADYRSICEPMLLAADAVYFIEHAIFYGAGDGSLHVQPRGIRGGSL